mmetsp:Transcript_17525/g.70958  ORF Transcript_17525/g.70958 Transcript_17525/m.70958 type:complete len:227 (-) Transcript_17525:164-844(-)
MGNLYSGVHGVREQICSRSKAKFSTVQRAARIALLVLLLFGCFFGFLGFFLLLLLGVLLGILLLVLLLQQRLHVVSGFVVFLPELLSNLDIRKTDGKDALISLSVCVVHRRPYPRSLTSNVLLQLDVGIDVVVEANLQSFFSAHEQSNTLVFVVLQYFDVTQAALLPAALTGMAEEFRPLFVQNLFILFTRFRIYFTELHDRFKVSLTFLLFHGLVLLILRRLAEQ